MPDTKHRLTPRAFLDLKVPRHPHVSPDGTRVVFEVAEADFEESHYVSRLWLADTAQGAARQITFSYEGEHGPRWSPDGKYIAFLSARPDLTEAPPEDEEEEHHDQIWVLPANGGEAQRLTNTREGVRTFEWTPDGSAIVYLADEVRPRPLQYVRDDARKRKVDPTIEHDEKLHRQFWEVGIEDRKPELLYSGDYGITDFVLSPDGRQIAYISNGTGELNDYTLYDLFVLEIEPAEAAATAEGDTAEAPASPSEVAADVPEQAVEPPPPRRVVERAGGKFDPQWSPDGNRLAFLATLDPALSYAQECVWMVDAAGGKPQNLFADVPFDAHEILWSRFDGALYARVSDRTNGPVARITPEGVSHVLPEGSTVECLDFDISPSGVAVAVIEDDTAPPELYALAPEGAKRALTELNKAFRERYALPKQEVVRWHTDGGDIEGVLVYPPDHTNGTPLPLVVQVHGGPKGHATNTLRSYSQHAVWATEGYLVLKPNFRGSEGYGNAFAVANRRDLGGGDFRDIMAGVDMLLERGLADPKRLGIMGGSYGGYMTNWAIGHTDRFAAAISMFGIFNLVTDYSNSSLWRWDPEYMGAFYWEDPEIYRQCSPATYLDKINTPVLIVHGDVDDNTFISNSKEMYQALRARGVTTQFVHYPREGHGVREPNHKLDEMRRCLAWFDRYLKGAGTAPPTAYRIGDKIVHDGYEMHVLCAEDGEYAGRNDEDGRLVEVTFSLASRDAVDSAWSLALDEIRLVAPDGAACPLAGVPSGAGGGKFLIGGENLTVDLQPDKDTGRIGVALPVAFAIAPDGGTFELRIADFPVVVFSLGPKEEKPDAKPDDGEPRPTTAEAQAAPDEEAPPSTPPRTARPKPATDTR